MMINKNLERLPVKNLPIKEWPEMERPREKLLEMGAQALADAELLAIFIRTGMPGKTALDMARECLVEAGSLRALLNQTESEFCQTRGFGVAKYVQFQAALELGRRYLKEQLSKGSVINNPQASRDYLTMALRDKPYEVFYAIYLDSKHRVIHCEAEPSPSDRSLTAALYAALNMVGIKLLDHFVVGESEVISFAELGQLS